MMGQTGMGMPMSPAPGPEFAGPSGVNMTDPSLLPPNAPTRYPTMAELSAGSAVAPAAAAAAAPSSLGTYGEGAKPLPKARPFVDPAIETDTSGLPPLKRAAAVADGAVAKAMGYGPEFQRPTEISAQAKTDSIDFIRERAGGSRVEGLSSQFADRLARAARDAEAATGEKVRITSLVRTQAEQAALHRRHLAGGPLAAPPGRSRHQPGEAADIARGKGLDWLHQNAGRYGLEFLKGSAFERDPVHIQLARGGVQVFRPGVRAPMAAPEVTTPAPVAPATQEAKAPEKPGDMAAGVRSAESEPERKMRAPELEIPEARREALAEALYGRRRRGRRNV